MMKLNIKNLINYLAIFTVFSSGFTFQGILPFADLRINYLIMAFVLLLCMPFLKGIYFNKTFLFLFGIIIVFSLYNVYIGEDTLGFLMKQVVGISLNAFIFYLLFKINNYDVKKLFKVYLNIAVFVGTIGLIQELSYSLGFKVGYDFSYIIPSWSVSLSQTGFLRVNSIMPEPADFCYAMVPAFFVSITSFSRNNIKLIRRWKGLIIILSVFSSFSSVGYIGIIFSLALLFYNYGKIRHLIVGAILVFMLIFCLYSTVGDFKMRVDDSFNVITGKTCLETTNLSTFALFSNALIAYSSFKDNPVFGSGLGSHEISYYRYIKKVIDVNKTSMLLINMKDANSLFLRLLSETGLFGLLVVFYFIFKFHLLRKNDKNGYLWIISNAILAVFLIRLIRCGHYFINGFFFFFWLYYFTWRLNKE